DFTFTLFATDTGGSAIAGPLTNVATEGVNGQYSVVLDFGAVFDGNPRWVEIGAQTNGGSGFTTLTPRMPLLAVAYVIMAHRASNLLGSLPTSQLSGTVPLAQLPAEVLTNNASSVNISGNFSGYHYGDGFGLSDLNPMSLASGDVRALLNLTNQNNFF